MFNIRLAALRKKHQYTQQQIADALGVTLRTYQRYEAGDFEPSLMTLITLADLYEVTLDHLVGRDV